MLDVNFSLTWNYKGQRGTETLFHTAIGNLMTALRDWAPAFRSMITEVLEPQVEQQFLTAGQGTWARLAPWTIRQKGHDTILFDSGNLFRSFQSGGQEHIEEISRDHLLWGSAVPYALYHQAGTGKGFQMPIVPPGLGRGMAMRKILELGPIARRTLRSILVRRMATIARREGYAITKGMDLDPLSARMAGASVLGI